MPNFHVFPPCRHNFERWFSVAFHFLLLLFEATTIISSSQFGRSGNKITIKPSFETTDNTGFPKSTEPAVLLEMACGFTLTPLLMVFGLL